jgi:hypothetical protein
MSTGHRQAFPEIVGPARARVYGVDTVRNVPRTSTTLWTISPELVRALDERLGPPVDSYVNGSQTWLVGDADNDELVIEFRLHPVAGYRTPRGASHYDVWEAVLAHLSRDGDARAIPLGDEVIPLAALWDGLESFAAYGDDVEPQRLAALATDALGHAPDGVGQVDHDAVGDAWERANGNVSIVRLLREQLES